MGLLLMEASTERLEYGSSDGSRNRLHLCVRADATATAGEAP